MCKRRTIFKPLCLLIGMALGCDFAFALPEGGQVVSGDANIVLPNTSRVEIHQASDKAIINWRDFSIGNGQSAEFFEPNSTSATLNRVTGGNVQVLGNRVGILDNSVINASGAASGGQVLVGGDYQGKNAGKGGLVETSGHAYFRCTRRGQYLSQSWYGRLMVVGSCKFNNQYRGKFECVQLPHLRLLQQTQF